jgi:hypothetical protein
MAERGMTETSPWVHDRAAADNSTFPTVDEMTEALGRCRELLDRLKAIRKAKNKQKSQASAERRAALQATDGAKAPPTTEPATHAACQLRGREQATRDEKALPAQPPSIQLPLNEELARILPSEQEAEGPSGAQAPQADTPTQAARP